MATSRKNNAKKGVVLYNKILKEFTQINEQLPIERKLSLAQRRKYVSEVIYPQYKGSSPSKVSKRAINVSVYQVLDTIAPKEECNPNYISPNVYDDISWFDLDEFIKEVLPTCIYMKVSADVFGETNIFNTLNYNYDTSGLSDIIEAIREYTDNESGNISFSGVKRLRPNKANDGSPENYYIDMVLTYSGVPTKELVPVRYDLPKEEKKVATSVKRAILERVKQLNLKKKRRKNARKKAIKSISDIRKKNNRLKRAKSTKTKSKIKYDRLKDYLKTQKQLENNYNKGNLTKEQYDRFMKELNNLIEQVKKQGGIT